MLVHTVFFWLNDDCTPAQREQFLSNVQVLTALPTAKHGWIGTPAATTQRPVIDSSYDVALTVVFDSIADHDAYQDHPDHLAFIEANKALWKQVRVYDAD